MRVTKTRGWGDRDPAMISSTGILTDVTNVTMLRMTLTHGSREQGHSASLVLKDTVYTDTGAYVCSFNDSQDLGAVESNTRLYVYVWDSIHLMTHSGFDFQQSVAYKSAEIPCR